MMNLYDKYYCELFQNRLIYLIIVSLLLPIGIAYGESRNISYLDHLSMLVDMERLTMPPIPGVMVQMSSSYDRRSHNIPQGWWENNDQGATIGGNYYGEFHGEKIMADYQGPGCVLRIWSAQPRGFIRIYVDDTTRPIIQKSYQDLLTDGQFPFIDPVAGTYGSGKISHLPIPYQKRFLMTVSSETENDTGFLYYQVNSISYPKDWTVEPFHLPLTKSEEQKVHEIVKQLNHPDFYTNPLASMHIISAKPAPGKSFEFKQLPGPDAIQRMEVRFESPPTREFLNKMVLKLYWDGEITPSVAAPLGAFFGSPFGMEDKNSIGEFKSYPLGMTSTFWYCNWVMPFRKKARIVLENRGTKANPIEFRIYTIPWTRKDSLYFKAKYQMKRYDAIFDTPFITTAGQGNYCGTMLNIFIRGVPHWWGEGDEKVWIDSEFFPSSFGTGSEDYFDDGYGIHIGYRPYFGCTYMDNQDVFFGQACLNYASMHRFHISDAIPYQDNLRMTIENYDSREKEKDDYMTVSYWYATANSKDLFLDITDEDLELQQPIQLPNPKVIPGALEAQELKVLEKENIFGLEHSQKVYFNGGAQWTNRDDFTIGASAFPASIKFLIPVKEEGRYKVRMNLTHNTDYGIGQFYINGKKLGNPVDEYSPTWGSMEVELGETELMAGDNELLLKITDRNKKAEPHPWSLGTGVVMVPALYGIDAIQLIKIND